jgi:hypothetical protein
MMGNRILSKAAIVRCIALAVGVLANFALNASRAEFGDLLYTISASDAADIDRFGRAVAISDTAVLVGRGLPGSSFAPPVADGAYNFDVVTGQQSRTLLNSDSVWYDNFASSLGVSGNNAIIGASFNNSDLYRTGSAYLFDVATGQELFKLTASDAAEDDRFGTSVDIDDNITVVGADHFNKDGPGAAYVFDVETGNQLSKLIASDGTPDDRFGYAVGVSGNTAIVGAHDDDDRGVRSGSAYLFNAETGEEIFKLIASDGVAGDEFGFSVGISGNHAIIGAPSIFNKGTGSAYVFDASNGQELLKLTAADAVAGNRFAQSVAISGNLAIVGAPGTTNLAGSVYLFDITTGEQLKKISSTTEYEGFGLDVDIFQDKAIVGAPYYIGIRGVPAGSAYVFDVTRTTALSGDFNTDGTVDAADYIVWRNGLGTTYTQADYNIWRANFGRTAAGAAAVADAIGNAYSSNIPEPITAAIASLALLSLCTARQLRRRLEE